MSFGKNKINNSCLRTEFHLIVEEKEAIINTDYRKAEG